MGNNNKIKIGISSCLLGQKVRYDGGHKLDPYLVNTLGKYVNWVPVCPEVEMGLPVPREAMCLIGNPEKPRLVTQRTNIDYTDKMLKWASKKIKELKKQELCGFIFKSRSPSSGLKWVKIYSKNKMQIKRGSGIFSSIFTQHFPFIPVEDDRRLHNPFLRENFIERVFVFSRWRDLIKKRMTSVELVSFHTNHKLLIMSHSPRHCNLLGRLVAEVKKKPVNSVISAYISLLMQGMQMLATVKKNTNVLMHIMGYFKKHLTPSEKQELLETIQNYHRGLIPLIVPITLINHFVRKFDVTYLKTQHYLNPHPVELMLRNHV
jgi:uncharacterized protein YbgA (DUF1722 family)/uncharacterized protein YbbK (DUF523 family)